MKTLALLRERIDETPREIERTVAAAAPPLPRTFAPSSPWVVTGVGASEGPARFFVALLRQVAGVWAEFFPLSAFATGIVPKADVCFLFSQNLSPNARLALRCRDRFDEMFAVTAGDISHPDLATFVNERQITIAPHGPRDESELLLRVMGPAAACVVATKIALGVARRKEANVDVMIAAMKNLPSLLTSKTFESTAIATDGPIILVGSGIDPAFREGLRLKLVEGLCRTATSVDVCGIVHGPLQSFWSENATVITLETENDPAKDLFDRLERVLPPHHRLLRLRATQRLPLAYFEHAAMIDHLIFTSLEANPRDLCNWPGKGCDSALYDVGDHF